MDIDRLINRLIWNVYVTYWTYWPKEYKCNGFMLKYAAESSLTHYHKLMIYKNGKKYVSDF